MENNKNLVSKVTGFIALALGIISIPMLFLPIISVEIIIAKESINIVSLFRLCETFDITIAAPICLILISVVSLLGAILVAVSKKALKITGSILVGLSFIGTVVFVVLFFVNELTPGFGLWIQLVCLLFATVLAIVSAVSLKRNTDFSEVVPPYNDWTPPATSSGTLIFYGGSCAGYRIPVQNGEEIVIGKDPAVCQVVIGKEYGKVSRKHCGVRYDASQGIYVVTDYSSNGTFVVNGQRLASQQPSYLQAGTTLNLAKTDNTFQLG